MECRLNKMVKIQNKGRVANLFYYKREGQSLGVILAACAYFYDKEREVVFPLM